MISANNAIFLIKAVESREIGLPQAHQLVQALEAGHQASVYRLSIDAGFLNQERAAYVRALASEELGGEVWEAGNLLAKLQELGGVRQQPSIAGQLRQQRRARAAEQPALEESAGSAMWRGVIKGILHTFAFLCIAGGFTWYLTKKDSQPAADPKVEVRETRTKVKRRPPPPNLLDRQTGKTSARARQATPDTNGPNPLLEDKQADQMTELEEVVKEARGLAAAGNFMSAFRALQEFLNDHPEEFWQKTVRVQFDVLRDFMREEFAIIEQNFKFAVGAGDLHIATEIIEIAALYTIPDGMDALKKKVDLMRERVRAASDGESATERGIVDANTAFFGESNSLSAQRLELLYDFSKEEHLYDWWPMGLHGRIDDEALLFGDKNIPWPGSTWLIHKGEFTGIYAIEYDVQLLQLNTTQQPHVGWGAFLTALPEGPWDTDVIENGAIGWIHPKGIHYWIPDREWTNDRFTRPMSAGEKYRVSAQFNGGIATWSIDGEVCRRAPYRIDRQGPRAAIMFGGGAFRVDNVRLVVTPEMKWLAKERSRTEELKKDLAAFRSETEAGSAISVIEEQRLHGFCYNPRQYCLSCEGLTEPDEICMNEPLGPVIPAWLPIRFKNATVSLQIKPMGERGGRNWYLSFLEGGVQGYSLPFLMEKTFLGLSKIRSDRVPATLENLEESHSVFIGPGEYQPVRLRFLDGEIDVEVNGVQVFSSTETWEEDGIISLGGFDWGGAGHYHIKALQILPLKASLTAPVVEPAE